MPDGPVPYLLGGATVAINLALCLVLGALASQVGVARDASGWGRDMATLTGGVRRGGFVLGAVGLLALLGLQAAAMNAASENDSSIGEAVWTVLKHTHFGWTWTAGLLGWVLAAAATLAIDAHPPPPLRLLLMTVGLGVFVWSRSAVSHAAAHGDFSLYIALDGLHLLLVSLWVGMVLVAAVIRLPTASAPAADGQAAARWVRALSSTATFALAGILATGALKTWTGVPSIPALWPSDYGLWLAVKVGLVLAAAALGGFNRFVVLPPLLRDLQRQDRAVDEPWRARLTHAVRLEAVLLLLALTAAAVLSGTEPPDAAS